MLHLIFSFGQGLLVLGYTHTLSPHKIVVGYLSFWLQDVDCFRHNTKRKGFLIGDLGGDNGLNKPIWICYKFMVKLSRQGAIVVATSQLKAP